MDGEGCPVSDFPPAFGLLSEVPPVSGIAREGPSPSLNVSPLRPPREVGNYGLITPSVNLEATQRFEKDFNWLLSPELSIHVWALRFLDLYLQFEGSHQTENVQADVRFPT